MGLRSKHERMAVKVPETLAELLGISLDDFAHVVHQERVDDSLVADFVVSAAGQTFVVEFRKSTGAAPVAAALKDLQKLARRFPRHVVPILAVPFMGEVGRRLCEEAGVGWIDLSGNAHIVAPGIRVIIDGRPNRFRSAGRPPNLFAPNSSRVARWLLIHPTESFTQRQIARALDMTEGFVSRIVSRLEHEGYIARNESRAIRVKDPALLLDAWRETYQFSKHTIHRGHVAARSGDALLRFVSEILTEEGIEYAATGLAAAWALTRFAAFRIATVYIPADPSPALLERLGCQEDPRGSNLWLVVPNDEGVLHGTVEKDKVRCVHPVQVYVDLKGHPERAAEAAERLRAELLTWRRDG